MRTRNFIAAVLVMVVADSTPMLSHRPFHSLSVHAAPHRTPFQQALDAHPTCGSGRVAVPYHAQETPAWCWAASGQMAMETFGTAVTQCKQVNEFCTSQSLACKNLNCCLTPNADDCQTGGWPPLQTHQFKFTLHPGPLSPAEVVDELGCKARPFLFSWKEDGGGGHMLVAVDFTTDQTGDIVIADDPDVGEAILLPFATYQFGYSAHWNDFYQIEKVTTP